MKHFYLIIFIIIFCESCNMPAEVKPEDIVKAKTMKLFDYMNNKQIDSIHIIYPNFSEDYMILPSDSICVTNITTEDSSRIITVNLTNYYSENHIENNSIKRNIIMTYCPNDSNDYIVQKSVGLVDKDKLPVEAEYSGYLKAKAQESDYEIIRDLSVLDSIKAEIKNRLFKEAKEQVTLELWYRKGRPATNFYRVYNRSNQMIGIVQFNASYKYETWPSYTFNNTPYARDVPAYSYRDVNFDESEFTRARLNQENGNFGVTYVTNYHLVSYKITKITFPYLEVGELDYTGNEYVEYVRRHSKQKKVELSPE